MSLIDTSNEEKYCVENDLVANSKGIYIYKSADEVSTIDLAMILLDYKDYLIENGIVKLV